MLDPKRINSVFFSQSATQIGLRILFIIVFSISLWNFLASQPTGHLQPVSSGALSCPACEITDPANAYDGNMATVTNFKVNSSLANGYVEIVYTYSNPIDSMAQINIAGEIIGSSTSLTNVGSLVMQYVEVELQDQQGNHIVTYGQSGGLPVGMLDSLGNTFLIRIISPSASVQRLLVRVGALSGAINHNVEIKEIWEENRTFYFVTDTVGTGGGYSQGNLSLCMNCVLQDIIYATDKFDPNIEFCLMQVPVGISTGNNYLYTHYDWNGQSFPGNKMDLNLIVEEEKLSTVTTSIFDESQIEIVAHYDDQTQESFLPTSPFLGVNPLYFGSSRYLMVIDLPSGKNIQSVEVRVYSPANSVANTLRLYAIFVEPIFELLPTDNIFLSGRANKHEVYLSWDLIKPDNSIMEFSLERSENGMDFSEIALISANSDQTFYQFVDRTVRQEEYYYRLLLKSSGKKIEYTAPIRVLINPEISWKAFPTLFESSLNIDLEGTMEKGCFYLSDMGGREWFKCQISPGLQQFEVPGLPPGTYLARLCIANQPVSEHLLVHQ